MKEAFTFDDILISPSYSDIDSRSEISLAQNFLGLEMEIPIISANMDYVTGATMAKAMKDAGGLGILHRFYESEHDFRTDLIRAGYPVFVSVGTRDLEESKKFVNRHSWVGGFCIDVAHGDHIKVIKLVEFIKSIYGPTTLKVIAGNVATAEGFNRLAAAGADAVKIGIGPGSVCTTREVTGVGVPQLSAIMDIMERRASHYSHVRLIADGGIKNSGDIVKALAAGADVVMLGSLLAGADECPGEVRVGPDNSRWRPYRGQSIFGVNGEKFVKEGIEGWVKSKGPVSEILAQLAGGIRSGMSYVGARNLTELRENAEFVKISHATHLESSTRIQTDI